MFLWGIGLLMTLPGQVFSQIEDPYADAVRFFELRRYSQASRKLEELIKIDTRCIECYDLLAKIAGAQNNDSLAVEWYFRAVQVEPENSDLWQELGMAEYRYGYLEQAISDLEQSLEINPNNPESHFTIGTIGFDLNDYLEARVSFSRAISLDSTIAKYYYQLGLVYYTMDIEGYIDSSLIDTTAAALDSLIVEVILDDSTMAGSVLDSNLLETHALGINYADSALVAFKQAYRIYPKYTNAYEYAAKIQIGRGEWEDVIQILNRGLLSAPETYNTRYWLGVALARLGEYARSAEILSGYVRLSRYADNIGAIYQYGLALYQIGEYDEAAVYLAQVVRSSNLDWYLEAQFFLARSLTAVDDDERALVVLDTLLQLDPTFYDAWIQRGDINLKLAAYEKAVDQYIAAVEIDSSRWEAFHGQALADYYRTSYLAAEMMLYDALWRADSIPQIYESLGDVAAGAGEDDFAIYYYSMALRLIPDSANVHTKLSQTAMRLGLWRIVREELLWLLAQKPDDATLLYRLGRVSRELGMTEESALYNERYLVLHERRRKFRALELRIGMDSFNPKHYRDLGRFYIAEGDTVQAREYFRMAVARGDTTLTASDYLAR